jgi:hypothetical protein
MNRRNLFKAIVGAPAAMLVPNMPTSKIVSEIQVDVTAVCAEEIASFLEGDLGLITPSEARDIILKFQPPEKYLLMTHWLPITEAPRNGTRVVCWRKGWDGPLILVWKTNTRIGKFGDHVEGLNASYFGDPCEMDDYDFAKEDGAPTHWHFLDPFPA